MGRLLFFINSMLLRIKRHWKLRSTTVTRLNLGSGMTVTKGWCNVDGSLNSLVSKMPKFLIAVAHSLTGARRTFGKAEYVQILSSHEFIHYDLRYGLPLADDKVDYIYSSHFFEHLYPDEARLLLEHCLRVLRPGGSIRISIPDLEYAISLYPENKESMLNKYFFIGDQSNNFSNHKYMYDFDSLSTLLENIGFKHVERCGFMEGAFPDIELLDNREKDSLIVQAQKDEVLIR